MKEVEIVVRPTGQAIGMYKDELRPVFESLGKMDVRRASNVEWEDGKGWTVRSAKRPELALRWRGRKGETHPYCDIVVSTEGALVYFANREDALIEEVKHFWELIRE